jgi:5-hydroxyisourate hydrolase
MTLPWRGALMALALSSGAYFQARPARTLHTAAAILQFPPAAGPSALQAGGSPASCARLGLAQGAIQERILGRLTTHVLDTAHGRPAAGVKVCATLPDGRKVAVETNVDGRCDAPIAEGAAFVAGQYRLAFAVGDYFRSLGVILPEPAFLDDVEIAFGVADAGAHYHVPLLVSPFGYSTYRGS